MVRSEAEDIVFGAAPEIISDPDHKEDLGRKLLKIAYRKAYPKNGKFFPKRIYDMPP
jgi:hypothetical protein